MLAATLVALAALAFAPAALALDCPNIPLDERLEAAEVAFVGRVIAERAAASGRRTSTASSSTRTSRGRSGSEVDVQAAVRLVDAADEPIVHDEALGVMAERSTARAADDRVVPADRPGRAALDERRAARATDQGRHRARDPRPRARASRSAGCATGRLSSPPGVGSTGDVRAGSRRRRRADGRRHRPGRGRLRAGRAASTTRCRAPIERGIETMGRSLGKLHEKGGPTRGGVLARVTPVDWLADADLHDRGDRRERRDEEGAFPPADGALPAHAILASNTSSIPITELAAVTLPTRARDRHALLQPRAGARRSSR